jgi:hypothetical protein
MSASEEGISRLLTRMDARWQELQNSIEGLTDDQLAEPGTMDEWSVRDMLAHIMTWEEQALEHLPTIIAGGRPPKYVTYGGIDAFNAMMAEKKRDLSIHEVKRQMTDTHRRLVDFVRNAPTQQFSTDTRARRRLRWDTYGHYALHAKAIREWRNETNA